MQRNLWLVLAATGVLLLAALAGPWQLLPGDGVRVAALLALAALLTGRFGAAWGRRGAGAAALAQVDSQTLEALVNNASLMSSFTRVVSFSRDQGGILQGLQSGMQGLERSMDTLADAAQVTRSEVAAMHDLAQHGDQLLQQTTASIGSLANSADGLNVRFLEVKQRSQEIEDILRMIQNVAMQTNLLSLNAAVEAARAGEQGRGFAVVADEVRKLAKRTDEATLQIRDMLAGISASTQAADQYLQTVLQDIQAGVEHSRATGQALVGIREGAQRTLEAATAMTAAVQSQMQTGQAMQQHTQTLAGSARESIEWVGKSNEQLRGIQGLLGQLKRQTTALRAQRQNWAVIADCVEEMRACNILIMNADSYREVQPVVERIAELDRQLDQAWQACQGRVQAPVSQAFAQALHSYRQVRAEVLSLARAENFAEIRKKVPAQVRPAYDRVKLTLEPLMPRPQTPERAQPALAAAR